MMQRFPVPPSPFEATACGARFLHGLASVLKTPPEAIFVAARQLVRTVRGRTERAAIGRSLPRQRWVSVHATRDERARTLPGDERIPHPIDTLTHGVTIRRPPSDVWPWLAQMGAGSRGGWYSYDWLDNGRRPSARRIVPALQHPAVGEIFPAMPGTTEGFTLLAFEPERTLTLGWLAPDGALEVTWTFVLDTIAPGTTRLLVRVRAGTGYRFHGLPLMVTRIVVRLVHFIMQRKQLLGIASRAEGSARRDPVDTVRPSHGGPGVAHEGKAS